MKIQNIDGTERNETRQEILARHAAMMTMHAGQMDLLASFHVGKHFDLIAAENAAADRVDAERLAESGLQTEINTSKDCVSLRDTLDGCADVLRRHPFGFKDSWTDEENKAAEQWAAGVKKN